MKLKSNKGERVKHTKETPLPGRQNAISHSKMRHVGMSHNLDKNTDVN